MARDTLICAEGIAIETLSAWRDGLLPPADVRRLQEHTTTCPACQARLADFEELARALLRQRELEPGDRILNAVRLRAARRPRLFHVPAGRIWGNLTLRLG